MRSPSVALWGTGGLAHAFAGACSSLGWPLPYVVARNTTVAAPLAGDLGADAMSLSDLQRGGAVDLVIAVPTPRARVTEIDRLLAAGYHIVAAPPLAVTLSDADDLVTIAGRAAHAGVALLYAEHLCLAPVVQQLLAGLGDLGDLPTHLSARSIEPPDGSNGTGRNEPALEHHGTASIAVALLAARICGLGPPVTVESVATDSIDEQGASDLQLDFAGGRSARIHASWGPAGAPVWDFQVATPAEVLRIDLHPSPVLERNGEPVASGTSGVGRPDPAETFGFTPSLRGFWSDIAAGVAPVLPASFGRDVVEIIAATRRSAARGEAVDLPLADRADRRAAGGDRGSR